MGSKSTQRALEAAERRQQRDVRKRFRELERRAKEQTKLSQIEQAQLEVETFENRLEVLLSVHKEQGEVWDWAALAVSLPPVCPKKISYHELRAKQQMLALPTKQNDHPEVVLEQARLQDELAFQEAMQSYLNEKAEGERMKSLAIRVLSGEHSAYTEALVEFSPLVEISELGSSIRFTVHSARLIECELKSNGRQAIPNKVKSLLASGKVSEKAMSKKRFHEIYQDYVCGCMLRVAREVFALLPVEALLITASADFLEARTGQIVEQPVLSAVLPRTDVAQLSFNRLDPSDALEGFLHRGDFKASRKVEAFQPITPLTPADVTHESVADMEFHDLLVSIQRFRAELKSKITELSPCSSETIP